MMTDKLYALQKKLQTTLNISEEDSIEIVDLLTDVLRGYADDTVDRATQSGIYDPDY